MSIKWLSAYCLLINVLIFAWYGVQFDTASGILSFRVAQVQLYTDVAPIILAAEVASDQLTKH
ncbi:MAG: hypothetical protein OFPI_31210 [Osedax symbiont Rs2]|nr:MAG: hypothetical protein OFPI_31210 [Osedax symbiont Rs2]